MTRGKFPGLSEGKAPYQDAGKQRAKSRAEPERRILKIGPGGRVVIPADFRKAMETGEGDRLVALLEDGVLRLISHEVGIRKAQAYVRSIVPEDVSLVDE